MRLQQQLGKINDRAVLKLMVGVMMTGAVLSPAYGDDAQTTWTTYLYQGPGTHFSVIDEVAQGTRFALKGCADGWCAIAYGGRQGYVQADVVSRSESSTTAPPILPQPARALVADPKGPCFEANQTGGNGGNASTVFCQTK